MSHAEHQICLSLSCVLDHILNCEFVPASLKNSCITYFFFFFCSSSRSLIEKGQPLVVNILDLEVMQYYQICMKLSVHDERIIHGKHCIVVPADLELADVSLPIDIVKVTFMAEESLLLRFMSAICEEKSI